MEIKQFKNATLILSLLWCTFACKEEIRKEIIILPDNFLGNAIIFYDQKNGKPDSIVNNSVIYKFPKNGIFLSKDKQHVTNQINNEYYYYGLNSLKKLYPFNTEVGKMGLRIVYNHYAGTYQRNPSSEIFGYAVIVIGKQSKGKRFDVSEVAKCLK